MTNVSAQSVARSLKRCALLRQVRDDVLLSLAAQVKLCRYSRELLVLKAGDPADCLCFLLDGRLKVVTYTSQGKEIVLSFIEPASHFGEFALIDDQPRSANVVTVATSMIAFLPKPIALQLFAQEPSVSSFLLRDLVQMIRQSNQQIQLLGYQNAQTRICAYLLFAARDAVGNRYCLENLSQRELASLTNTARETVSRVLGQLQDEGLLVKEGKSISLLNIEHLQRKVLEGG